MISRSEVSNSCKVTKLAKARVKIRVWPFRLYCSVQVGVRTGLAYEVLMLKKERL